VEESWLGWVLIVGMGIVAFLARAVFVLPAGRLRLPPGVERVLRYAPAAALVAIIVPDLALVQGAWAIAIDNARFIGGLAAFAIAAATRSILLTIAVGMAALTLVRLIAG
jgi:branched-subunit amino acid transport protein